MKLLLQNLSDAERFERLMVVLNRIAEAIEHLIPPLPVEDDLEVEIDDVGLPEGVDQYPDRL